MMEFMMFWMFGIIFVGMPVMIIYRFVKRKNKVLRSRKSRSNFAQIVVLSQDLLSYNREINVN